MNDATVLQRLRSGRRIGFLFGGGASRCAYQIGVVEALAKHGIYPAACLGVSGGSWNAAAVAAGCTGDLRRYWRFFCRMPAFGLANFTRELSPFGWRRVHGRAFHRYIGAERLRAPGCLPVFAAMTRLRDGTSVIADLRDAADPLEVLLASSCLPPFFMRPPIVEGERYVDGGLSDSLPYEFLLDQGCDQVVVMVQKGECEGGLFRNMSDANHSIPAALRNRVHVIRPLHRLPVRFTERDWSRLASVADAGALRAIEVLSGNVPESSPCSHGRSPSSYASRAWQNTRTAARRLKAAGSLRVRSAGGAGDE
jgi:predicted acylesterase/phospholipase RssA